MSVIVDDTTAQAHRAALEAFLERHHLKPHQLAKKAGFTPSTLYNFLAGTSNTLSTKTLEKIAQSVGTTIDEILGGKPAQQQKEAVTVLFIIGVHGKMYPSHEDPVPHPIGVDESEEIACAVVKGDALHPLPSGLRIYFNQHPSPPETLIGKLCVVRSSCSNEPMIREIQRGSSPGLYNFVALSTGTIYDADVLSCHLVRAITQP